MTRPSSLCQPWSLIDGRNDRYRWRTKVQNLSDLTVNVGREGAVIAQVCSGFDVVRATIAESGTEVQL
jgi:hypothetical protein